MKPMAIPTIKPSRAFGENKFLVKSIIFSIFLDKIIDYTIYSLADLVTPSSIATISSLPGGTRYETINVSIVVAAPVISPDI